MPAAVILGEIQGARNSNVFLSFMLWLDPEWPNSLILAPTPKSLSRRLFEWAGERTRDNLATGRGETINEMHALVALQSHAHRPNACAKSFEEGTAVS